MAENEELTSNLVGEGFSEGAGKVEGDAINRRDNVKRAVEEIKIAGDSIIIPSSVDRTMFR